MTDAGGPPPPWDELAAVAADVGPALVPAGHDELLASMADAARSLLGAAACSLALLDEDEEHLVFRVASGAGAEEITGVRVPVDRGVAGWVVTSGQPLAVSDTTDDPRFARDVAEATGYVPRSILAVPLETERRVLGVLEVLDPTRGAGPAERLELLAVFAGHAAVAIERADVFADLGRALFEAAAGVAAGTPSGEAFRAVAAAAPGPRADLAELAAVFADLGRLGPGERRLATRLVGEVAAYLRARSQP